MRKPNIESSRELSEKEPSNASIRLEFLRHDERVKAEEGQADEISPLTAKGRKHAAEIGKTKNPVSEMAVAYGSPRVRAMEGAMRQMLANEESISPESPDSSLEDIRALIDAELKYGKKDIVSSNLDFQSRVNPEYEKAFYSHYEQSKDALMWLYTQSDALVRSLKDRQSTSFLRQAGNVAELVKRYLKILPIWARIARENPEKYQKYGNEMQRFLGSHQTVTESFLLKVIDKIEGQEGVKRFIDELTDKNGFAFSEGFSVELRAADSSNHVLIKFKDKQWDVDPKIIDEIIAERQAFNASF